MRASAITLSDAESTVIMGTGNMEQDNLWRGWGGGGGGGPVVTNSNRQKPLVSNGNKDKVHMLVKD